MGAGTGRDNTRLRRVGQPVGDDHLVGRAEEEEGDSEKQQPKGDAESAPPALDVLLRLDDVASGEPARGITFECVPDIALRALVNPHHDRVEVL